MNGVNGSKTQEGYMVDFKLWFPLLSGGKPRGVNSSGIAAFKGDPAKSLAREWAQNAIDAYYKTFPVELDFELKMFSINDLPCFGNLKDSIYACAEYWPKQQQEQEFCSKVLEKFDDKIPVLILTDRGTKGLRGKDDDQQGEWFGLVEGTETSVGDDGRGGSFGIGKNAAFAASIFQTVYFSTHSVNNEFAFKGSSVLMTHRNREGQETQADGAIGVYCNKRGKVVALRDAERIPPAFQRTEEGLSTFIPGYKPYYKNPDTWIEELVMSLISNFWPAIHFEKVIFRVQDVIIEKNNLSKLMKQHSENNCSNGGSFQAYLYYLAFTSVNKRYFKESLPELGEVELYVTKEDEIAGMPNNIALARQNGMIIKFERFRGLGFPFSGLLFCDNDKGNKLLRAMEPPQHNDLHPKQVDGVDGSKVLQNLHSWIRRKLLELKPKLEDEEYELPQSATFFPMPEEDETPFEQGGKVESENLKKSPSKRRIEVSCLPDRLPSALGKEGDDIVNDGSGDDDGENVVKPRDDGDGVNTGGESHKDTGTKGVLRKISQRGVYVGKGAYKLFLRSERDFKGVLQLFVAGDSVKDDLRVTKAESADGSVLKINSGRITGVSFSTKKPTILLVTTDSSERFSLDLEVRDES